MRSLNNENKFTIVMSKLKRIITMVMHVYGCLLSTLVYRIIGRSRIETKGSKIFVHCL